MNLHAIAAPLVAAINPFTDATMYPSSGYTTGPDGTQAPAYGRPIKVKAQVQALTYTDIMQVGGLQLNGERRAIYLNGDWDAQVRPDGFGGDKLVLSDGSTWIIAIVLENWALKDGWVKVAATLQVDTPIPRTAA